MDKNVHPLPVTARVQSAADVWRKQTPRAPAPYRPQSAPKCLQPKAATPPDVKVVNAFAPARPTQYGQRPSPLAAQTKTVSPHQRHVGPPIPPSAAPFAPVAYSPQPAPKVLQTKEAAEARPGFGLAANNAAPLHARPGGTVQLAAASAWAPPRFGSYSIDKKAVSEMIRAPERGEVPGLSSRSGRSGVAEGEVGSYALVQYLEKKGDKLTGDHQPSGAAVKEALREELHIRKYGPLLRSHARNAYKKAITIVVTDEWHRKYSRTYGGRNSAKQIGRDAKDLFKASVEDYKILAAEFKRKRWAKAVVEKRWQALDKARKKFFKTGKAQAGTLD